VKLFIYDGTREAYLDGSKRGLVQSSSAVENKISRGHWLLDGGQARANLLIYLFSNR
jgi:hypothetical protein